MEAQHKTTCLVFGWQAMGLCFFLFGRGRIQELEERERQLQSEKDEFDNRRGRAGRAGRAGVPLELWTA